MPLALLVGLAYESLREGTNAELRVSESRFHALAESREVLICDFDAQGHVQYANPSFELMLGYLPADLIGQKPYQFIHPDDKRWAINELTNGESEGGNAQFRLMDKDGSWHWFEGTTRFYTSSNGEPRMIALSMDISERKTADARLERHQEHLEDLVRERSQELLESNDRVRQSERLASIGTLAAGMAHQLNNPVGMILTSSEYALLCTEDEDGFSIARGALSDNVELANRCGRIIRSILQFARNEPTEKWVEDLNEVLRRSIMASDSYAESNHAKLVLHASDNELPSLMSPIQVEQVIVNLIHNAVQSRPEGAVVELVSERVSDHAKITIRDNGAGIPEDIRARILDPFFTTRLNEGGTGLGLSVAHGIVVDHHGTMQIDSQVEKGTSVILRFPLAEQDEGQA
jgi:PAS domain S-box-containing protein